MILLLSNIIPEGDVLMKLINPLGRSLDGGSVQPLACYCSGQIEGYVDYYKGKGPNDTCANCGCFCDQVIGIRFNTDTYRGHAKIVDRASTPK